MRRLLGLIPLALLLGLVLPPPATAHTMGKFYIVGMGTAPDLVTLRAVEVMKQADVFLLESEGEKSYWGQFIGDRPVWYCPDSSRKFLGTDPSTLADPRQRALALSNERLRRDTIAKIEAAVNAGKSVVSLQGGDPMMFGMTWYVELLPKDFPSEIVPGVGAFQAVTAAVKASSCYGFDTNSVILTPADWPQRAPADRMEKLMEHQSTMVFYTMLLDYPELFAQLARHYPADTPVAVVCYAGDREKQQVIRSTVGRFLTEVEYAKLPREMHALVVGKFLTCGQARKGAVTVIPGDVAKAP